MVSSSKKYIRQILPLAGVLLALAVEILVPNHRRHPSADFHYYRTLLFVSLVIFAGLFVASFFNFKIKGWLLKNGALSGGGFILLTVINLITAKLLLLPALLFPSFDNILSVFIESKVLIIKCVLYSFRLLGVGVLCGAFIGFLTGVVLGISKTASYWATPVIKIIGPIPATAWIPILLSVFPTTFGASAFIVGLAVWFPVVLLTSSGIQNVPKVYFEVGKTLGTSRFGRIVRIALPAALPSIFQGLFFGVCSAFIALMTGEMFGARFGIGWYISMEKELAEYKGVYAGLILIALFCLVILNTVLKVRSHLLKWQKGLVVW